MHISKKQSSWELYKRLFGYLKSYWKVFSVAIVSMLLVAVTMPAFGYLLKPLINEGFVDKNMQKMTWMPLAIVGLFLVRGIFNFINEYCTTYLSSHLVQRMRGEMFVKLMRLPSNYFSSNSSGRIMSRVLNDAGQITDAGFNVITVLAKDGVSVIGLLGLLFYLDWKLTLITFAILPVVAFSVRLVSRRLRNLSLYNQKFLGQMMQVLNESIDGARVIKVYGGQKYETNRFNHVSDNVRRNNVKQSAASSIGTSFTQLMAAVALAIIIYTAASQAHSSDFSAGDFMAFLSSMIMMFDPIKRMTGIMQSLQRGLAAAESVFGFLDEAEETDGGVQTLNNRPGDIEFRQVVHRYPEAERNSLNGVNLIVPQGQVVALVGASGCGKTTLANMLPRFFNPTEGQVLIGGTDIREYTLESLREQMALVSQDVVLFNGSVASNIAYGQMNKVSEADIVQAAKAANAWEFIKAMPQGLQTEIGENGLKLSGGQRQRLAIARALLKNAPILILDEATSALDNESERLVQAALENLMVNRTTIVIAHRLSTIEKADNIVVMHEGRVVEQGTHTELLAKGGRYADLHSLQFDETSEDLSEKSDGPIAAVI
ncbi:MULTISPECIES: lipid A export permease/ATP-binding protein MsbA [unclassified Neisseria]|uniref:lipid A export permease/ATP-binding protein MsbA n=1 Tax=unclassified Neisseria TaxID=2623750 RepID=UPI002665D62B|nr:MULTISPECIES: lipid A export permease/ATP-binding protein MsbA [unclassified Neisseria]MDO1510271.1 lipid A export permease/ATP-binding protein MsbA [Neisseria sp. MVDL19-042950]MDO1516440.1 lipid A export permease/ATP-binding protein MsbA [Neisseria sp. MVDL18-041461]MDO1563588.1 lipid A export permease/ATP-binding protein MsbA [Neisseria sp. MVDL20-010259]